jgi:hypothetical protein
MSLILNAHSGVDFTPIFKKFSKGTPEEEQMIASVFNQSSVFLVAYSIHKFLAPLRLSITLGCTPVIVKYLKKKGILTPVHKPSALK